MASDGAGIDLRLEEDEVLRLGADPIDVGSMKQVDLGL
jgi:hypothetical protein